MRMCGGRCHVASLAELEQCVLNAHTLSRMLVIVSSNQPTLWESFFGEMARLYPRLMFASILTSVVNSGNGDATKYVCVRSRVCTCARVVPTSVLLSALSCLKL